MTAAASARPRMVAQPADPHPARRSSNAPPRSSVLANAPKSSEGKPSARPPAVRRAASAAGTGARLHDDAVRM